MHKKNLNIEKIAFIYVQIKSLAMHITNQKFRFDIFTVCNILMIFGIKEKSIDRVAIATNIPMLLWF